MVLEHLSDWGYRHCPCVVFGYDKRQRSGRIRGRAYRYKNFHLQKPLRTQTSVKCFLLESGPLARVSCIFHKLQPTAGLSRFNSNLTRSTLYSVIEACE